MVGDYGWYPLTRFGRPAVGRPRMLGVDCGEGTGLEAADRIGRPRVWGTRVARARVAVGATDRETTGGEGIIFGVKQYQEQQQAHTQKQKHAPEQRQKQDQAPEHKHDRGQE